MFGRIGGAPGWSAVSRVPPPSPVVPLGGAWGLSYVGLLVSAGGPAQSLARSAWTSAVKLDVLFSSRFGQHSRRAKLAFPPAGATNPVASTGSIVAEPRSDQDPVGAGSVIHEKSLAVAPARRKAQACGKSPQMGEVRPDRVPQVGWRVFVPANDKAARTRPASRLVLPRLAHRRTLHDGSCEAG